MVRRVLVGRVNVDTGQVIVVDPSFLDTWKNDDYDQGKPERNDFSHSAATRILLSSTKAGQLEEGNKLAVVSEAGYGEGTYQVYATYSNEGRVTKLEIEFAAFVKQLG